VAENLQIGVLLQEYGVLKSEQAQRIGFRDNLLYVNIGAVGGVASVALGIGGSGEGLPAAFLLVPWVTAILGWTYLVNDQKITAIRKYVEGDLEPRLRAMLETKDVLFRWESFHRSDARRRQRKWIQLVIDLSTFVFSGVAALVAHVALTRPALPTDWPSFVLGGVDAALLLLLAWQFYASDRDAARAGGVER
jgi:RsiW-degrading membrane proteinase PrsW (M82 family)